MELTRFCYFNIFHLSFKSLLSSNSNIVNRRYLVGTSLEMALLHLLIQWLFYHVDKEKVNHKWLPLRPFHGLIPLCCPLGSSSDVSDLSSGAVAKIYI